MKPLDIETAEAIIDFSGGKPSMQDLANLQLEGTVALHNMIADPDIGFGYLADEVGMGKTYVALGVVALMRYFNPALRVLYICPSRNVQEKWDREYLSFIKHNVKTSQYRIRTACGKPAAPYVSCRNVPEMIRMATIGYFSDFFVGKDSFSISLSKEKDDWIKKYDQIRNLLPAHELKQVEESRKDVKDKFASALNYILPTFDLVVIDEAHNFKHDANSSDRNRVLSKVLGFADGYKPRVKHALLLSATPYDRNIQQLRNQLTLVGKSNLLPMFEKTSNEIADKKIIVNCLQKFMVRRLNELNVNGQPHTRNMYRIEHRSGEKAEVVLKSDQQKLITALVQKKVGEMMNRSGSNPAFQIGMLASFESYAQTAKTEKVEFDGKDSDKNKNDAKDRNVVEHIVESYKVSGLGNTLPHPKMDSVCDDLSKLLFEHNRKQLVFVRRVKSVGEIKDKLDDLYNHWLESYIAGEISGNKNIQGLFRELFDQYKIDSLYKDGDISGGNYVSGNEGELEDKQPPKNDTFYTWFFRGKLTDKAQNIVTQDKYGFSTPEALRIGLSVKSQNVSLLLEINWVRYICKREKLDLEKLLKKNELAILKLAMQYSKSPIKTDKLNSYRACQLGFLRWLDSNNKELNLRALIKSLVAQASMKMDGDIEFTRSDLIDNLFQDTLYTVIDGTVESDHNGEINDNHLSNELFPLQSMVYDSLKQNKWSEELFNKLDVHSHLVSLCLRTGHGVIDIYLSRLKQGRDNLTNETRLSWLKDFVVQLIKQKTTTSFSTYAELSNLATHFDLIIKNNIPKVYDLPFDVRRTQISHWLNPVSPVIGATGETAGSRSAQARKFRMPGYPLALISTDVFQEGEDLHTFCDSVVHYGLSGSPVSIEQKTGRVDRVNSLVQRRFIDHKQKNIDTDTDDFIQVSFPYIKESIELLQVRQLCKNINLFIDSLHDIDAPIAKKQDIVGTDEELKDRSGIVEQIKDFLISPYAIKKTEIRIDSRKDFVLEQNDKLGNTIQYVKSMINEIFTEEVFENGFSVNGYADNFKVRLDSAKSSGELLLIAEVDSGQYNLSQNNLVECMQKYSWNTLHRTLAREISTGCFQLSVNIEMLVGDEHLSQVEDLKHFFQRIEMNFEFLKYEKIESDKIKKYANKLESNELFLNDRPLDIKVTTMVKADCIELFFKLGTLERSHKVSLYEVDGLCIFLSQSVVSDKINKFGTDKDKKIIEYTWVRNAHIDVVEFLLDPEGGISGRIIHPIESLDWHEFLFCAYLLAVEADRLEYIVEIEDRL